MASWQMPKVVKNISDTFCDLQRMSTAKHFACGSTLRCLQVNAVPLRRTMWWMSMIATTPIIRLFVRRVSFIFLYSPLCLLVSPADNFCKQFDPDETRQYVGPHLDPSKKEGKDQE